MKSGQSKRLLQRLPHDILTTVTILSTLIVSISMEQSEQKMSAFRSFSPVQMFVGGIVVGILVLCTIGFFIMLGLYFGGSTPSARIGGNNAVVNNVPTGNTGAPAQVTVREVDEKNDHIRGNKNADVTIVEYSDFECPFCKNFHNTMKQVIDTYGDDVRWVYRHLPLDSLHSQARKEALASECAAEQGKFWEFADIIFAQTTSNDGLDLTKLSDYAKQAGVGNVTKFNDCLNSSKYASAVQEDEQDAQAAGAQGTPYSVIVGPNGETVVVSGAQPYSAVEASLKQFLN